MRTDYKKIAFDGVIASNPTLKLVLGTCPTLALTTLAMNGIGMGLAVTFVLICSNAIISCLRKVIPSEVRIPAFVLIIATFVTIVRLVLDKLLPDIYDSLGLYLPLIVVNCIILARAESFASKNTVLASACDGLFMGIGFTLALTVMGAVREILGAGAIFGFKLWDFQISFFSSSAGAFFTYAMFIMTFGIISSAIGKKKKIKAYELTRAALNGGTEQAENNAAFSSVNTCPAPISGATPFAAEQAQKISSGITGQAEKGQSQNGEKTQTQTIKEEEN